MLKRFAFLLPALPLLSLPSVSGRAQAHPPFQVSTVSHGLSLTLTIPAAGYPHDALVRITLRMQNISHGDIGLLGSDVQVLSTSRQVLYPPSVPPTIEPKGVKPTAPLRFHPGQVTVEHEYIVLRGPYVRARVWLGKLGKRYVPPFTQRPAVVTRPVRITLLQGEPPTITVTISPMVSAEVHPVRPETGPLLYALSYLCTQADGATIGGGAEWARARSRHIAIVDTVCASLELHLVAGWLNRPVATIDYVKQALGGAWNNEAPTSTASMSGKIVVASRVPPSEHGIQ